MHWIRRYHDAFHPDVRLKSSHLSSLNPLSSPIKWECYLPSSELSFPLREKKERETRVQILVSSARMQACGCIPGPSQVAAAAKWLQSCPMLCDPIDGSPPGSPVPGILQARTMEWVAISSSNTSGRMTECFCEAVHLPSGSRASLTGVRWQTGLAEQCDRAHQSLTPRSGDVGFIQNSLETPSMSSWPV